jgi:hypothetical protein
MRRLLALAVLCVALPATAEVRTWSFRVLLDDRQIGEHRYTLRAAGEQLELRSEASFDVRLLFVNAYRYRHEALEHWRGGCLATLESTTDDNGERESVSAAARGGRFVVVRASHQQEHEGCVRSFAYWNPQILGAQQLLNNQTGELLPVTVLPRGEETVRVRGETLHARRYRISAPRLQIDVWYAGDHWVALEAPAAGGRTLRYELM